MQIDKSNNISIEKDQKTALQQAAELYYTGKIFIYPTDTIYGIGGDPFDKGVVKRISELKGRDDNKQFIWLLPNIETVYNYIQKSYETHFDFLTKLWPAPVTVILKLNSRIQEKINQENIAIRIPQNDFCLKLLNEISKPLISTSVNKSGNEPLTDSDKIISEFSEKVDAVFLSSQKSPVISSTIIDLTTKTPKLVREGSIKFVELLRNFS